jgi:hypothetical protein
LQQRQHSVPQEYEALYHLHSVIDMHKVSKQEISFTPVTLIHAQVGFFAPRLFTFEAKFFSGQGSIHQHQERVLQRAELGVCRRQLGIFDSVK